MVDVLDDDGAGVPDPVDFIVIDMTLEPSSAFTARETYVGLHDNGRIDLSFRVQYLSGFEGRDCTNIGMHAAR